MFNDLVKVQKISHCSQNNVCGTMCDCISVKAIHRKGVPKSKRREMKTRSNLIQNNLQPPILLLPERPNYHPLIRGNLLPGAQDPTTKHQIHQSFLNFLLIDSSPSRRYAIESKERVVTKLNQIYLEREHQQRSQLLSRK
jgi:hypothetical protein